MRLPRASLIIIVAGLAAPSAVWAQGCAVKGAASTEGLAAVATADGVAVEWTGDQAQRLRLTLATTDGVPLIRDLSIWNGGWTSIIENAVPQYSVTTGLRRMSNQQMEPLRKLGVAIDQAVLDKYRWDPFWDAPLDRSAPNGPPKYKGNPPPAAGVPGMDQPGTPRSPQEIESANAHFVAMPCAVVIDGARLTVDLTGVSLGAFQGKLRFTVYRGTNLVRQEILASTDRKWVAYKFSAGLKIAAKDEAAVQWRDNGGNWQIDRFGGAVTSRQTPLIARNRVAAYSGSAGALAFFPEPHKFFWAREIAINMGYQWVQKSADGLAFGIRQNEREDESEDPANWALYSARPGTTQHMPMFLYPRLGSGQDAIGGALGFTRNDSYKALPGYKTLNHHYHTDLGERAIENGTPDIRLPDMVALKSTGINIVSMVDSIFLTPPPRPRTAAPAGGGERHVPPPQNVPALIDASFAAAAAQSDKDFLIWPSQEIYDSPLGGHTDLLFSHKVRWDKREDGKAATGDVPYRIGTTADLMAMVKAEDILLSMPHPRTKGSTGYPDEISGKDYFLDPHFHGTGMRWGMGLDGSEERLCEFRCWPLLDDMNNWMVAKKAPLKKALSISEVRHLNPGDDVYGSQPVTYILLDTVPLDGNFAPIIRALRDRESFWTTGEVLAHGLTVRRMGSAIRVEADVEWTFPLNFVEVHYGDGRHSYSQRVEAHEAGAYGQRHFAIDIPAKQARWVRFSAWDIASNGAVIQPVKP